jgi:hypothetical protein
MDSKILEQLENYFNAEFDLVQHDLGQLEEMIKQKMQLLGQGLLQRAVERSPNGYKGSSIGCQCGSMMKFVGHRSRHIHTIFGWIEIQRAYYHCIDCGVSVVPYDAASGLGSSQLSPGLAKACCLLAVDDSFAQVAQKIDALMGQKVSSNTVEQVVHTVGTVAVKEQEGRLQEFMCDKEVPQPQVQPSRLYVAVDGTTAHQTDGWHEAKVGCIYWDDERIERHKRYVACFDNSETFGWGVWLEACRCGLREAKEAVYIGDGAGWVRTEHERHFKRAVFIVDWFHAS